MFHFRFSSRFISLIFAILLAGPATGLASAITQTIKIDDAVSGQGSGISGGFSEYWHFNAFDASLGHLDSVIFSFDLTMDINVVNQNTNPSVVIATPMADLATNAYWFQGAKPAQIGFSIPQVGYKGDPVAVPGFGYLKYSTSLFVADSHTFADQNALAFFLTDDPNVRILSLLSANTDYGGVKGSAVANLSLTYNYSVPDHALTALLLAMGLLGCLSVNRRSLVR